ncbi:hypothetical protein CTRI78_v004942 [Colletotrichum trifolii]|uniref:Uncharacterized protein n=1 Tax=Colletotrichum trifolii TaxID=5466 RepID=A0A4R8RFY7_COLTR|nr:hypothetical protein CTRI78_v004942 [Colletotrichum trifolii]
MTHVWSHLVNHSAPADAILVIVLNEFALAATEPMDEEHATKEEGDAVRTKFLSRASQLSSPSPKVARKGGMPRPPYARRASYRQEWKPEYENLFPTVPANRTWC